MNKGKKFEANVERDWKRTLPKSVILRIPDQQSGYKGSSSNICDFFGFTNKKLFMIECKETEENTLNFAKLPQYDSLIEYKDYEDVYPGALIWFSSHDKIVWVNVSQLEKMKKDGKKSVNIKMLDEDDYILYEIPSRKKIKYLTSDFTIFNTITK